MLYLISLGLADEKDMSLRALGAAKKCAKLYAEFYTTNISTDAGKLSELIGREVVEIKRADLEENSSKIISQAKSMDIGILAGGDALSATTHISLLLDAKKAGIKTKVIHGSSVFTAVAETGLQLYKFGATTTVARPQKNYSPISFYDTILGNKKKSLHSLILLDIGMSVKEAVEILLESEKIRKGNVFGKAAKLVAACRLGLDGQLIKYGGLESLLTDDSFDKTPAVLILPGKLHVIEREFLELL